MDDDTPSEERWLAVPGFEGRYEVSDMGRVRSLDRVLCNRVGVWRRLPGRVLKPAMRSGHSAVRLYKDADPWFVAVHQLVLMTFVGPCPPGKEGCHGPDGALDNRLSNLRWDTHSANMLDRNKDGTCHNRNRTHCSLGHRLAPPNITGWYLKQDLRKCLACHRARANRYYAESNGRVFDFESAAHNHYAEIMGLPTISEVVVPTQSRGEAAAESDNPVASTRLGA